MKSFAKTVLLTGLLVGTLDLTAAYVHQYVKTGKFADKMLYYIAGGGLGLETSMQGGFWIGLLGLFFHFFIAFSFTLLFFLAYPKIKLLRYNPYIVGFLYGYFIGTFMALVVLRLSALPDPVIKFPNVLIGWTILSAAIGIPVALIARWYYGKNYPATTVPAV